MKGGRVSYLAAWLFQLRQLHTQLLSHLDQLRELGGRFAVSHAECPDHLGAGADGHGVETKPTGALRIHGFPARHGLGGDVFPQDLWHRGCAAGTRMDETAPVGHLHTVSQIAVALVYGETGAHEGLENGGDFRQERLAGGVENHTHRVVLGEMAGRVLRQSGGIRPGWGREHPPQPVEVAPDALLLGNVAADSGRSDDSPAGVPDRRDRDRHIDHPPTLGEAALLIAFDPFAAAQPFEHPLVVGPGAPWRQPAYRLVDGLAHHFGGGVTQQALGSRGSRR